MPKVDYHIRELNIRDIPLSSTWIMIGSPGSGKTCMLKNMILYLRDRYPVGRAFVGSEKAYKYMCSIFQPLFVSNYYNEKEVISAIDRQKQCNLENVEGYMGNYQMLVFDDVTDDVTIFNKPWIKAIFKLGSQHWNQLAIFCLHYALDMPTDIRKSVSYVAIFQDPNEDNRKKLYNNFGGICGTYDKFCKFMDELTGNYMCMIIDNRNQSTNVEDRVFYFKGDDIQDSFDFGCKEYKKWNSDRYNTSYKEEIFTWNVK